MAKRRKEVIVVMHKGNRDVEANMVKTYGLAVLFRFTARVREAGIMEDPNTVMICLPDTPSDPAWVQDRVLRYVDILGATTDAQVDAKVDRLMARYNEQPDASPEKVGADLLIEYLNRFYLMQRSASVFRREI